MSRKRCQELIQSLSVQFGRPEANAKRIPAETRAAMPRGGTTWRRLRKLSGPPTSRDCSLPSWPGAISLLSCSRRRSMTGSPRVSGRSSTILDCSMVIAPHSSSSASTAPDSARAKKSGGRMRPVSESPQASRSSSGNVRNGRSYIAAPFLVARCWTPEHSSRRRTRPCGCSHSADDILRKQMGAERLVVARDSRDGVVGLGIRQLGADRGRATGGPCPPAVPRPGRSRSEKSFR